MRLVNAKKLVWRPMIVLMVAFSSRALFAQRLPAPTGTATTRQPVRPASAFCLHGARIDQCRSFAIFEIPIGGRLVRSLRPESAGVGDAYVGLELGAMVNRDDSHAIGATVTGAASAGESYFAINARSRTWVSSKWYNDLSAGVVAMGSTGHSTAYGLTAGASSGYSDILGIWVAANVGLIGEPRRVSVHAGGRLGSYAALSVIGLAVAILALGGGIHDGT